MKTLLTLLVLAAAAHGQVLDVVAAPSSAPLDLIGSTPFPGWSYDVDLTVTGSTPWSPGVVLIGHQAVSWYGGIVQVAPLTAGLIGFDGTGTWSTTATVPFFVHGLTFEIQVFNAHLETSNRLSVIL